MYGVKIVSSPYITPHTRSFQFKFPKSKKKRIRLKWSRRNDNWKTVIEDVFYKMGDTIFLSEKNYKQLQDGYSLDTALPKR